ncbi:putative transcription factor MADS-type1 family [Medicago truncatula]|uniref:MADS-box transcription factor family protein n=1 Tax=Medicago truncatula TaxID=3880 RepID=G7L974_MEDTR|nr:agamous-like MADS-box protein AGL61 [Medicago truncatula]AET02733.1 MADS-box transcription factor family protein [Medicago truncatula]RHN40564.1 putative transcription factor MADS-type1 family [Medicago truncatula]
MGRRKIEIAMVKKPEARQVTFSKRRMGLFKKANELAILCGTKIVIVVFSPGNKPYSFGHPSVDAIASKFLQQELDLNDVLETPSSNIEDLNQQHEKVMADIAEAEKEDKANEEMLKEYKSASPKEWKDSLMELKNMVKSRLCDLDISDSMMLLAKEPVVGIKN